MMTYKILRLRILYGNSGKNVLLVFSLIIFLNGILKIYVESSFYLMKFFMQNRDFLV